MPRLTAIWCSRARTWRRSPIGRSRPTCSTISLPRKSRRAQGRRRGGKEAPSTPQEEHTNVLGKLTWDSIPWSQPIPLVAGGIVIAAVLAVVLWVIVRGYLPYLWNEWITSVDHKRIGVMYLLLALLMLLRGFIDAVMMRSQQAVAFHAAGYLPPEHFDQIFSAHGTIMIFFAAMPL